MLKNYLILTLRTLMKHKVNTAIKLSGLSIATGCTILLFLFIYHEWTFDTFHKKADDIYRIYCVQKNHLGEERYLGVTPAPLGPALQESYPEIKNMVRIVHGFAEFSAASFSTKESFRYVDSGFFDMFTFPILYGDKTNALSNPSSIVMKKANAVKFFGTENAVGYTIALTSGAKKYDLTVTAIVDDIPNNSTIQFNYLIPIEFKKQLEEDYGLFNWYQYDFSTYIEVASTKEIKSLLGKSPQFVQKYLGSYTKALGFQPLKKIHLNTIIIGDTQGSNLLYSYILGGVATLILLLAGINFTNLSLGESSTRLKEIGIRKVMGAQRSQLMKQYLSESLMLCMTALILGFLLAQWFLPYFKTLVQQDLLLWNSRNGIFFILLVIIVGIFAILAAGYPAMIVSKMRPCEVIQNRILFGKKNQFSRILMLTQYGICIFLICCMFFMMGQLDFLKKKNLGFNDKDVVIIGTGERDDSKIFKNTIIHYSGIKGVSVMEGGIARSLGSGSMDFGQKKVDTKIYTVDKDFFDVLDIEIIEGRNFKEAGFPAVAVVNESFVKKYCSTPPIGEHINDLTIIGICKDFNYRSLHHFIEPLVLSRHYREGVFASNSTYIRLIPERKHETIDYLKNTWKKMFPSKPFYLSYLQDAMDDYYKAEERWYAIVTSAGIVSLFIACVGLFGMVLLSVSRRTKEIGIRKVLGASLSNMIALLSKEYMLLVLAANVIAWPLAWYAMNKWLQNFAYRIEHPGWIFLLSGLTAFLIAALTVSYQTIKTARTNPVESLRYE